MINLSHWNDHAPFDLFIHLRDANLIRPWTFEVWDHSKKVNKNDFTSNRQTKIVNTMCITVAPILWHVWWNTFYVLGDGTHSRILMLKFLCNLSPLAWSGRLKKAWMPEDSDRNPYYWECDQNGCHAKYFREFDATGDIQEQQQVSMMSSFGLYFWDL